MNQLLSIRHNVLYAKAAKKDDDGNDVYVKSTELIFLVDVPKYKRNNELEITRERGVKELRFDVNDQAFEQLIEALKAIKEVDHSEQ
jgi:hypothetical protein